MEKNVCKMTDDSIFLIDIEKILKTKAGKKYKYIPRFVVSYLKRIVHQDELNVPLGGQDGVALGYILGKHYNGNVRYLVNDLLMNLHGLAPLCIPINKTGSQSRDFPKMVEAGFASDNHIIMFPAGLCSRRQGGEIKDLEWKKTFVTKSIETHRDVVPLHFEGRNSDFFYNLANICKALGIKFNIAMLYLADEMLKNRHKTFTLTIGKPIPWQTFDKTKTPAQWAQFVKDVVYKL